MAQTKIVDSFNYAAEGLIYVLKTQRNMRLHFLFSVFILVAGIYVNLSKMEFLLLLAAVVFVLFAEMLNTAVEFTIDLVSKGLNPLARIIKDISAGAVLIASVNALTVVYMVFSENLNAPFENTLVRLRGAPWHITFIALIITLSLVISAKVILHRGTPFRGGMPSGHAAFAFALWTAVLFSTDNNFVIILTLALAFLIARSRTSNRIHSAWEVLGGSVLGVLTTALVFKLLK